MRNTAFTLTALLALHSPPQAAQASCSSDGAARPVALFERFISADCEACWSDRATPAPSASALVLDWIAPGVLGDDAPLSAAASTDALQRLQTLGRQAPTSTDVFTAPVEGAPSARLRVAHGMAFNDYLGTSIAFTPARAAPGRTAAATDWRFYLLLVETVPAGTEGTPVARNMVRNMVHGTWDKRSKLSNSEQKRWMETRPMRIPDGAQPERLRVVGWVQDAQGRVVAAAQSDCGAQPGGR
ncbi:hypothetical protein [Acidovorax carolinensis]|uniref:hypothetical protein n=1 Tax=Acidovorax carolinensis TaxID=553814 RepID=UPI000B344654|nr:hypothetical protein [Acidovorax carolinensis]ART49124.1 hypothetical protein CBP33_14105 [Acidovorax carolinensis]